MNRQWILLLLCLMYKATAFSAPVFPKAVSVRQPDGSRLTIIGHGDEFCHYMTTADGYTIVKGTDGYYRYATLIDGQLMATPAKASDVSGRNKAENLFLQTMRKGIAPEMSPQAKRLKEGMLHQTGLLQQLRPNKRNSSASLQKAGISHDYRGLVLLVNFSDRNFSDRNFSRGNENAYSHYNALLNQEGFNGYEDTWPIRHFRSCTGSGRDYFSDNSYGQFQPEFDVVGPVEIGSSQYDIQGVDNTYRIATEIFQAADSQVDFSRYDSDGDGIVDMVYILYAGYSSVYMDNDECYIWPHAGIMSHAAEDGFNICYDGVEMGRFACSAEIYGWESEGDQYQDGIGLICHEFAHVLGFKDHYDVQGYQEHPNTWDLMASGNYNGTLNDTPCALNAFEKAAAGFIQPLDISNSDGEDINLVATELSQDACLIRSKQPHVSFFMENRQPEKWDKGLVGHGLLVWRVDSVRPEYWEKNIVNVTTRTGLRLVRAYGTQGSAMGGVEDIDFDPFPGTRHITSLTNETPRADLVSYDRYASPVILNDIAENDGIISFRVDADPLAGDLPMSDMLCQKLYVTAERQDGDSWVGEIWEATAETVTQGDNEQYFIYNLVPNHIGIRSSMASGPNLAPGINLPVDKGVKLSFLYQVDGSVSISAQRVAKSDENSIWFCNFTDVAQQGAGGLMLELDRHGVPVLPDDVEIGWCAMQPSAYMVSEKKMISRLAVYRNLRFSHQPVTDGITTVPEEQPYAFPSASYHLSGRKIPVNSHGIIIRQGKKWIQ